MYLVALFIRYIRGPVSLTVYGGDLLPPPSDPCAIDTQTTRVRPYYWGLPLLLGMRPKTKSFQMEDLEDC